MEYDTIKQIHFFAMEVFVIGMITTLVAILLYAPRPLARRTGVLRLVRMCIFSLTSLAFLLVWVMGIWMAVSVGWYSEVWFWVKVVIVFFVIGAMHGRVSKQLRLAASEQDYAMPRDIVLMLPVLIIAVGAVVYLVVFKPF